MALAACLLTQDEVRTAEELGQALPGITGEQDAQFVRGRRLFRVIWGHDQPFFNAITCIACHLEPEIGGTVDDPDLLVRFVPDDKEPSGWAPHPRVAIEPSGRAVNRTAPEGAESRRSPALFGLGLLEAIPASELEKAADPGDSNRDGVSGRSIWVGGKIGRFGWKAAVPTIDEFVISAFKHELGLGLRQGEFGDFTRIGQSQIRATSAYIRLLSPPAAPALDPPASSGKAIFSKIGCASCHISKQFTGASELPVLNKKTFYPYTDLLLHDVGPGQEQRVLDGPPSRREYRTPALWGLGAAGAPYWHDGSVKTMEAAIVRHEGEATRARDAFRRLDPKSKSSLLAFLAKL